MSPVTYGSWGRLPHGVQRGVVLDPRHDPLPQGLDPRLGFLPYGNGRSYGDSCLNAGGLLLDMRSLKRVLHFDAQEGVLEAEAGLLLADVLELIVPRGWFLPVTPGTRFVTLGGAVANDVHGKNHHARGSFGRYVDALELWRSDGSVSWCTARENTELFRATIGGLGLTGVMTRVRLRLMPIESSDIDQDLTAFSRLEDFATLVEEKNASHEYTVAWIDTTARGKGFGRGLLIAGNHAAGQGRRLTVSRANARLSVPFVPPLAAINRLSLSAFNAAYFAASKRRAGRSRVPYGPFFYPLDAVRHWNRLYGPRGLHQHQSVVPFAGGMDVVRQLLEACQSARAASFLTVLKTFGAHPSPGLLSFPRPGITLTLDFPNNGARTLELLERLDALVLRAGGAVNPYKDSRMSATTFSAGFPQWPVLERLRDPLISSSFWRRAALGVRLAS